MPPAMVNRETVNNRFKLGFHRLAARKLKTDPDLLKRARRVVRAWAEHPEAPEFVSDWTGVLEMPAAEVRRALTQRGARADLLRSSSPFGQLPGIASDAERRRLLKMSEARAKG